MKEIVINKCFGGFGLSDKAIAQYKKRNPNYTSQYVIDRECLILVDIVKTLGVGANGQFAELSVVEIPSDVNYTIDDYEGKESIEEVHRSWG